MANMFNLNTLSQTLQQAEEQGLTFEDKQEKWNTAEDVADIVNALENTGIVHYLKLEGNTMGVEAAEAIGKALEKHPEFRKAFWRNMFTGRLKSEIPQALKHLSKGLMVAQAHLAVLDLSDNALGPNGMIGLEDLLSSRVCYSLKELYLNNCGLGIGGGKMLSKALIACHAKSSVAGTPLKLTTFVAGRNRLENEGAKAISMIFVTLKTLERIEMPQNSIYHDGIAALAKGFMCNPNLQVLNLNDNTITEKGAAELSQVFWKTKNLREINFGDCLLRTNGGYLFVEALEQEFNQIESIDLSFNEMRGDAGLAIICALANKPNLEKLNLNGNQFGREVCAQIEEAVKTFPHPDCLTTLDEDLSADEDDLEDNAENSDLSDEEVDEEDESYVEDDEYVQGEEEDDAGDTEEGDWQDNEEENKTPDKCVTSTYLTPTQSFSFPPDAAPTAQAKENNSSLANAGNIFGSNASKMLFAQPKDSYTPPANTNIFAVTTIETPSSTSSTPITISFGNIATAGTGTAPNNTSTPKTPTGKTTCLAPRPEAELMGHGPDKAFCDMERVADLTDSSVGALVKNYDQFICHIGPCSLEWFNSLKGNRFEAFVYMLCTFEPKDFLHATAFTALKIAHLSIESNEALDLSMLMFQHLFTYAHDTKQEYELAEFLLQHMRIIKYPENVNLPYNEAAVQLAIRQTLENRTFPSTFIRDAFQFHLDRADKKNAYRSSDDVN